MCSTTARVQESSPVGDTGEVLKEDKHVDPFNHPTFVNVLLLHVV